MWTVLEAHPSGAIGSLLRVSLSSPGYMEWFFLYTTNHTCLGESFPKILTRCRVLAVMTSIMRPDDSGGGWLCDCLGGGYFGEEAPILLRASSRLRCASGQSGLSLTACSYSWTALSIAPFLR